MSSLSCQCPAAAAIATIPNVACPENFGQIQKVAFQRLRLADGTPNSMTDANIKLLATWQTALAATNGSKIVVSPYINAPADGGGDARMSSGGNDDLGGIAEVLGSESVQFTGQLRSIPQDVIATMKQLMCEAQAGNLGVYLFDENGNIEGIKTAGTSTTWAPIPIRALFIGDKIHGNFDARDANAIQWNYLPGYSDKLDIVKPTDFNPLTDLVPASS